MRADNGDAVERCKDEPKRPEEVKIPENNNVCELFYDTRSGGEWDEEKDGGESNGKKIRDPVFFMDKNVTACDLPEIVVCYKENTYHVVKDICVDEGVPVQEKFLFGDKDSVKCSSNSEDLMIAADKVTVIKASSEDSSSKVDDSEFCNDPNDDESPREDFADAEGSSSCHQEDLIVTRDSSTPVLTPSEISRETEPDKNLTENVLTLGDILSREDEQRHQEQSAPQLQGEVKRSLETEGEKREEPEQTLTSNSTTTSQEANRTCNDPETESLKQNYLTKDSYEDEKRLSRSFDGTRSFGETSFSAAEAVSISGHITYTGPITYSGSLSVRSDASTTSGRSFAFPILQSEWNSSPVRMAKADKRRHKGWRHSFLCCRFS